MSIISDIYQQVQDATYEAAAEGMQFTIITWRKHGNRIKLYRLNEKAGFWILCGIAGQKTKVHELLGRKPDLLVIDDHPPLIGTLAQQAITNWIKQQKQQKHGVTRK